MWTTSPDLDWAQKSQKGRGSMRVMEGWWWVSLCVCVHVHVQVCHFGSVLTICVPGVRGSLSVRVSEGVSEWVGGWVSGECMGAWVRGWGEGTPERRQRDARGTPEGRQRGRQRDARGTPGRTSDPLAVHIVPRLPRKSGGDQGTPEGHRGVHPTPWPTPWRCTLSHACHAKAAETKWHQRDARGTPGRTSDPLATHVVPRLPRKSGGDQGAPEGRQRDARAYIRPLGNEWVSEWLSEWVSVVCVCVCEWVSEGDWVCVCVCVSEWESVREEGREGRSGYRTKNKNPTRQCGEKIQKIAGEWKIWKAKANGWFLERVGLKENLEPWAG